jgi:hypothetical protein
MAIPAAVFTDSIMACFAYVASSIPRFVRVKMGERPLSMLRHRSDVSVVRIIAIVHVTIEVMTAMKPWASSNENPAIEPIRPVITIGSAVIRGIVEVTVRAHRRHSDVDGNLSRSHRHTAHHCNGKSRKSQSLPSRHNLSWKLQLESKEKLADLSPPTIPRNLDSLPGTARGNACYHLDHPWEHGHWTGGF